MPTDIERFTEATNDDLIEVTNAEKVIRFLVRNNDKAFTPSEIADGTGLKKNSISTVLRRLEERELIQHKGDYWAIGDEERVRDAYGFHQQLDELDEQLGKEDVEEWMAHAADDTDE